MLRLSAAWVGLPLLCAALLAAGTTRDVQAAPPAKPASEAAFKDKVTPFLNTYCNTCHNSEKNAGGVALDVYTSAAHAKKDPKVLEAVVRVVEDGSMPPKKAKAQPAKADRDMLMKWVGDLNAVDCTAPKDPGRVTLRRLNRNEYSHTLRDLLGLQYSAGEDLPADDVGYGFDNIGDVLSLPPILLEKYLSAADKALDAALPASLDPIAADKQRFTEPPALQVIPRSAFARDGMKRKIVFTTEGSAFLAKHNIPAKGKYTVRVTAWGKAADGQPARLAVRVDGKDAKVLDVTAAEADAKPVEATLDIEAGDHRIAAAFANPSPESASDKRTLGVRLVEIIGPVGGGVKPLSDGAKRVLVKLPGGKADEPDAAKAVLAEFARRAYRRPVQPAEVDRLMKLYSVAAGQGDPWVKAIRLPLKAVLASPQFLFKVEADPPAGVATKPVTDFELAVRLSYFLWSAPPDQQLYDAAQRGDLRKPDKLTAEIGRMLKDWRAEELGQQFASQWLNLRLLDTVAPDESLFPGFGDVQWAAGEETRRFFNHVVKEDRPILELLDANYTFVNAALAKHYGLKGVSGDNFRKVELPDRRRGGITTMVSVLTISSNPTRTSPVKRGKWLYENILGLTAPPAAPDVPELPPVGQIKGTVRQQLEQHRSNPACASCHAKLDPLGFGLENFDAVGRWRDKDNGKPVDASGVLPDGAKFDGPEGLRKTLVAKSDQFRKCLAEKLLTFALGRGLESYDKCAVDEIVARIKAGGDKFSALVTAVVESDPFQKRAGKRSE